MKTLTKILLIIIIYNLSFANNPKNIIILIGDGMGTTQVTIDVLSNPFSAFTRFKLSGFSLTQSANQLITDSGAGGTAISTGERTKNHYIAFDTAGNPLETIMEKAIKLKKSTGIIATSSITDATPASFSAHVQSRKSEFDIAEQQANSNIDIFIGGGGRFYLPNTLPGGKRTDGNNILNTLQKKWTYVDNYNNLTKIQSQKIFALLDTSNIRPANERDYTLGDLTNIALSQLSKNKNGFVLMVEGSQIDWACHGNDQKYLMGELKDFSTAINAALDFAQKDKNTLVIVLADHETAGTSITKGNFNDFKIEFISRAHTATIVPVFAYGPGAELFTGINKNYEIGRKLKNLVK
ncbi:MAG TPA: alkaline phosphatase [Ignavibacteriales bacterium]|nr:alkaline phosphatase [Ignavibacteriales bacterium]HOL81093.1 alkaline phosphatase [Ignavibacteriales bacterium]HOM66155.1 alkaline phosphatase [Ignavibacteriales bacterium]HPD66489.1 alkaline phosphatase [Ignavibacteriales bacterium]HPP34462.1 alkaline phosphatase [Ignavibacteriales bacterium]